MSTSLLLRLILLLGVAQVAAAQSTGNVDSNTFRSAGDHYDNLLLLEMKNSIDLIRRQLDQQQLQHETDIRQLRRTINEIHTDINECSTNNGGCHTHAVCSNTYGSFTCKCREGYSGDGFSCTEINECSANNGGCDINARCSNTPGSFTCNCNEGFTGDGISCSDINECYTNNGGCDVDASCLNTPGSSTCQCNEGFTGDGTSCSDIDECSTNNGGCDIWSVTCSNTPGSFRCNCETRFTGDGFSYSGCEPVTPTLTHVLNGTGGVLATALLNDQLFVTREGVANVSVYDKTSLQLKRQLTSPRFSTHLHGLATCATNNFLYVSDWHFDCIHRVDLSVASDNAINWPACGTPSGLSVNNAGNVLVACLFENKVKEYTPSGTLVREISHSTDVWQAVQLRSGLLAVSRWYTINGIATVSVDGRMMNSYGNESVGSRVGQMNSPRCMAVDKNGYILVADYGNNRILVVNPTLTDAHPLPLPVNTSLVFPRALNLDQSHGRLYIGEYSGQRRILVFDNVVKIGTLFNN